jgi:streptomycin 6-kinase
MRQVDPFPMPRNLARATDRDERRDWAAALPSVVRRLEESWSMEVGEPFEPGGETAWVAPVLDAASPGSVLKVVWRHPEAEHEADGLRAWGGDGAVLLHDVADASEAGRDDTVALLLERCRPGTSLASRPEVEQDEVVAGLLRRLWRQPEPGQPFRPLQTMCDEWADEFDRRSVGADAKLDPGLAREGTDLFRSLPGSADRRALLATDLHAGNILAAEREPWLVIDPKPYVGDPTYDALQHLLNCPARLHADPHGLCRRMADLTGLDPERLRLWLFARCVQESPSWPGLAEVARALAP